MYSKILLCCLLSTLNESFGDLQDDISKTMRETGVTLSRRRRYLTFPEGSSFQMVYDLTYPSVALMGDLFLFGNTAVMAWKLPNEPIFLDKNRLEEAKNDSKMMEKMKGNSDTYENTHTYTDSVGNDWQVPMDYWNPHFEERPNIDQYPLNWDRNYPKRPKIWNYNKNRQNFYGSNYPSLRYEHFQSPHLYHHIHKRSRRDLYKKIENMFTAFKKDGKACLLKAICQITQLPDKKGSLVVEFLKTIFKTRPYENYPGQDYYDSAAKPNLNCEQMFSKCKGSILNHIFVNKRRK